MNIIKTKQAVLTPRLFISGFQKMGHVKREPDTRTMEQLLANIEYFAQKNPEVAMFKQDLKAMKPKYLGLVSDICELANHTEMLNTAIDIKKPTSNGKSLFQFLMEKLPQASKENPASLDLSKAIIDNTDSIASKYALSSLTPLYSNREAAAHIEATVPLVSEIANATLNGGYLMDYSKENNFVNAIKSFISPSVQLEKLKILPKIMELADKAKCMCQIDAYPFITGKTPINKIAENMETFAKMNKQINMSGRTVNLTEFLEKNTNFTAMV